MKDINATVIVNLASSEEEILSSLHKDARWGINRAKRESLSVEESEDWTDFYPMYEQTMKESGVVATPIEILKGKTAKLFVCKKEGKVIAGAGIWFVDIYNKEIPRLYFNASLKENQAAQPNNLLYWHCILWCKSQGYKEFDLGGWQINAKGHLEGVNKFKEKWGKVVYFKKDYPLHKALGRKLVRNFTLFRLLNNKIRKKH